jgi:ABC-type transport system involved in cytochrome c biogenesis permease subunit
MIARPAEAIHHKVFRIDNDELLKTLGLTRRKEHYYAYSEFQDKIFEIENQARAARKMEERDLSAYQRKLLEFEQKLGEVITLSEAFAPTIISEKSPREDVAAAMQRIDFLERGTPPLAIPPVDEKAKWTAYSTATFELWKREIMRAHGGEEAAKLPEANVKINPAVDRWSQIFNAYAKGDAPTFNREVAGYQAELTAAPPLEYGSRRVSLESFFNRAEPFYYAAILYLGVFLLAKTSWIAAPAVLQRSAFWLLLFTFGLHTLAIVARIYISGRPPVTNLYTSAVFIGWGCVALAIIFESFYRQGIGSAIGGVSGYTTLLIAHYLSLDGDTFGVMQAVLDTQFWLATHVVTVAMGYATTFLAGLFGIYYILLGIFTPKLDRETGKTIASSIYGILCFAIFFSFVGTVLGGLWADDSWGRFWGWDPKENGALIIVLWNAIVLHARWGKMVGDRGMAVLAVLGNICTCWSWFGVNELGVGLHSYGFTEGVLKWLAIAAVTHLTIAGLGAFIPLSNWRSFKGTDDAVLATSAE